MKAQVSETESVSTRTIWRAELTDKLALVQHVAANPHLFHLLTREDAHD